MIKPDDKAFSFNEIVDTLMNLQTSADLEPFSALVADLAKALDVEVEGK